MDATTEIGRNPVSKHKFSLVMEMSRLSRGGTVKPVSPSRETKVSDASGDREILIFPVELTTSRISNLTRLVLTLGICDDHTYTHSPPADGYYR